MTVEGVHSSKLSGGFLAVMILAIAAFLTRLMPLSMSPYPFNNDSLTECGITAEILETGHLEFSSSTPWYGTHGVDTPLLNVVMAFFSSVLGVGPLECAQVLGATVAVLTVCGVFIMGKKFSGELRGGVAAGFMAVLMGTFVFTTGSIWKEMLGISLLVLSILCYVRRTELEYRMLWFLILLMITFVHHLVAAVAFLLFAYMLVWSWSFSLRHGVARRRNFMDLIMVVIPTVIAAVYYYAVSFDRLNMISSPIRMALLIGGFSFMCFVAVSVLSMRNHSKWTFSPILGVVLSALIFLDYFGLVFPYSSSAANVYILLGLATVFLVSFAWYGAEVLLENTSAYRAVQLGLLLSPLTIVGYGFISGLSLSSHQVLYRSFDFFDIFIFMGVAVGIVTIRRRRPKLYPVLGCVMIAALVLSFPFAYDSGDLLGVRHDTQVYEVEAVKWMSEQGDNITLVTDERLGYIGRSMAGITKDSALPLYLAAEEPFPAYPWYYMIESSWTTEGVNNYPYGRLVLSVTSYNMTLEAADVLYIAGPMSDQLVVFSASLMGWNTIYGTYNP
jgi:hypothetical protein